MIELREYQKAAIKKIDNDLMYPEPVLLSAMMGAGKTVIVCSLIKKYLEETSRTIIVLAHKAELVKQFYDTLTKKLNVHTAKIGVCAAKMSRRETQKRITIGTIQTFISCVDGVRSASMLIVDEVHRINFSDNESQYSKVIASLKEKNSQLRILGVTATPYRLGHGYIYGDKCAGENLFREINHQITYEELKNSGFLMPLQGKVAIHASFEDDLSKIRTNGDYVLEELSEMMTRAHHLETAVDAIQQHCQGYRHICVFCCTIAHAEKLSELLGDDCTTIHSNLTDIERYANLKAWKEGQKRIITSVNILSEGVDFPFLDCLVMARPTKSTALFLQSVGRVLRIEDGKEKAFLLDLTDNTHRFGTDLDNPIVIVPQKVQKKIDHEKSRWKTCPKCFAEVHCRLAQCDCGHRFRIEDIQSISETPEMKDVAFAPPEPEEIEVGWLEFHRHKKDGKPDSLRVDYHADNVFRSKICSEWLCFDHEGFAQKKAVQWWEKMCDSVPPDNVTDALHWIKESCHQPDKIIVKKDGKFLRVVDHIFETKKESLLEKLEKKFEQPIGEVCKLETSYPDDSPFDDDIPF